MRPVSGTSVWLSAGEGLSGPCRDCCCEESSDSPAAAVRAEKSRAAMVLIAASMNHESLSVCKETVKLSPPGITAVPQPSAANPPPAAECRAAGNR